MLLRALLSLSARWESLRASTFSLGEDCLADTLLALCFLPAAACMPTRRYVLPDAVCTSLCLPACSSDEGLFAGLEL